MRTNGEHHPAFEEYCECIFELREDDLDVIRVRIAERLDVSRAAVTEMTKRMRDAGLVTIEGSVIRLTVDGEAIAQQVVRRHRLAERFLTDVLGLSWAEAHHEAGKWEHVMSNTVEAALDRLLGTPTTCPHGNPIPGSLYEAPDTRPLAQVDEGVDFVVARIPEELEFTPGLLEFLEKSDLLPGRAGRVVTCTPDGGITVDISGQRVDIAPYASHRILVTG